MKAQYRKAYYWLVIIASLLVVALTYIPWRD